MGESGIEVLSSEEHEPTGDDGVGTPAEGDSKVDEDCGGEPSACEAEGDDAGIFLKPPRYGFNNRVSVTEFVPACFHCYLSLGMIAKMSNRPHIPLRPEQ